MSRAKLRLRFGLSPCPNDTFTLHALLHGLVRTPGVELEPVIEDVESLNERMLARDIEVTKGSFAALAHARAHYAALRTGAALGVGNGPLVVARTRLEPWELGSRRVLVPGAYTTAALLFRTFHPEVTGTIPMRYDLHPAALRREEADAAVVIHELRFTYAQHGLHLVEDLGERYAKLTRLPLPLGGIFVRRDVDRGVAAALEGWVGASLAHARAHPEDSREFVRSHAQELDEGVTRAHVDTYVNEFSDGLGKAGEKAVQRLLLIAQKAGAAPPSKKPVFVAAE